MSTTDQQLLDLARSALEKRLRGGAVEEYGTGEMRFRGMPINQLYALIERLELKLNVAGGGGFAFVEGIQS